MTPTVTLYQGDCLEVMRDVKVEPPFVMGKVVIPNILDTDADIVLTNC